jgi:Ca-activated chloride channel family protein
MTAVEKGLGLLALLWLLGGCVDAGGKAERHEREGDAGTTEDRRWDDSDTGDGDSGDGDSASLNAGAADAGAQWAGDGDGDSGDSGDGDSGDFDGANTNVALGGSQDFGYFRRLVDSGVMPRVGDFDAAGFFAEHHTPLPEPDCGERVCLQAMLGVLGNLMNGNNCTMLQLGLNSPIAANPDARPPLSLAVVIDVSGSMARDGKIDFVRDGLELLIDGMRDEDQLAIITYSDGAEVLFPMQDVALNRVELRQLAQQLAADGSTNLHAGLEAGYQEVLDHYDSARQNRVILLSDGEPTVGITSEAQISAMSRAYNSDGVGLTTVGLGTDFNVALMRGLAELGDGNAYFLEDAGAVDEVFAEELAYFTVPVAFDLQLQLTPGEDYDLGRAYGSPLWEETSTGGALDVPSVFLAHRVSHEDVTDAGGRRGGGSALLVELMPKLRGDDGSGKTMATVATIDVSFREPGSDALVSDSIAVDFPLPPWETPERGHFDAPDVSIIHKSFVMLNIYVGFELASEMFYGDEGAGAITMLDNLMAAVEDYNEEIQDVDIDFDLQLLQDVRDLIAAQGLTLPDRTVPLNDDPWPVDD